VKKLRVGLSKQAHDMHGHLPNYKGKFDALISGLQSGSEFDMVASAMTITDERKQSVDFSDPYINSNQ